MALKEIAGFRRVQVQWGETLQQLAARELGDASQWARIASMNNLTPPYLTDGSESAASARVIRYGDTLMIPAPTADIAVGETSAENVLKRDVALPEGHLAATASGDLALVAGHDNLRQALQHRIGTEPGELLFHLAYGCQVPSLLGEPNQNVAGLVGQKYVERALRAEARVARTQSITVTQDGDVMKVEATGVSVTGHPFDVNTEV